MRISFRVLAILTVLPCFRLWSAEGNSPGAQRFALPEIGESQTQARFSEAEVSFVSEWIRREVPEYPASFVPTAAENFLEELRRRYPEESHNLLSAGFPANRFTSVMLRHVGAVATGGAHAALREKIAIRRIAMMQTDGKPASDVRHASDLLEKIRDSSAVQHRRVLEGRLEDDELRSLLEKVLRPAGAQKPEVATRPVELSASDLVSEYARRNQTGSAVSRLQAYTIEGRLTGPSGEASEVLLFKMRPNRFRLMTRQEGRTRSILASDGNVFWMQVPGQPARSIPFKDVGERRHVGEFTGPLFVGEGYVFERLADGMEGERKIYRLAVRRADGSGYVSRLDQETFHEIGRENADRSIVHYSDHREVAGIVIAHREEVIDPKGGKNTFVISRVTPNPGLVADYFRLPAANQPGFLDFERAVSAVSPSTAPATP